MMQLTALCLLACELLVFQAAPQADAHVLKEKFALQGPSQPIHSLAFDSKGTLLASGDNNGELWLWDVKTGKDIATIKGHDGRSIMFVGFVQKDDLVVSAGFDGTIRFWDVKTGRQEYVINGFDGIAATISADGKFLAFPNKNKSITIWNVETAKEAFVIAHYDAAPRSILFANNAKTLILGDIDGEVRIWDLATGKLTGSFRRSFSVDCLAFLNNEEVLVAGSSGSVQIWDYRRNKKVTEYNSGGLSLAVAKKRHLLISGGPHGIIKIWDSSTGKDLDTLWAHEIRVTALALSPDGVTLASGAGQIPTRSPANKRAVVKLWEIVPK
jgi:WD40 repeat protein